MKIPHLLLSLFLCSQAFGQSPCGGPGPVPFQDHGKWGYVSPDGIVISARFDLAGPFGTDGAIACVANLCGVLDEAGSFVPPTWDRQSRPFPESYSEGLAPANESDKWGYVDRQRNVVIPFQFKYAGRFDEGMARVLLNNKFFFVNRAGTRMTPEFDGAFDFHEGLAAVNVGKNVGYINRAGSFVIPPAHQSASGIDFSEGVAAIRIKGKVGFMDRSGKVVIEPKYDDVYAFSDGLAPVKLDDEWGYVDKIGNLVIPIQYQIAHMFSEGMASVERNGKWQYIGPSGKPAFAAVFDSAMPFCGGVASVRTFQTMGKTSGGCRSTFFRGRRGIVNHAGDYIWRDAEEQTWHSPVCD